MCPKIRGAKIIGAKFKGAWILMGISYVIHTLQFWARLFIRERPEVFSEAFSPKTKSPRGSTKDLNIFTLSIALLKMHYMHYIAWWFKIGKGNYFPPVLCHATLLLITSKGQGQRNVFEAVQNIIGIRLDLSNFT